MSIFFSCETEDILPVVQLTASNTALSEAGGEVALTASLNSTATIDLTISLLISGSASISSDFLLASEQITINKGNKTASVSVAGLQDQEVEGVETILVSIANAQNALLLSNNALEISILDDDADSDEDGVLDANDNCPTEAGVAEMREAGVGRMMIPAFFFAGPGGLDRMDELAEKIMPLTKD